jgi:hypothetical protein
VISDISGTCVNGAYGQDTELVFTNVGSGERTFDSKQWSPTAVTEMHSLTTTSFNERREGTIARGTGKRTTISTSATWGSTTCGTPDAWFVSKSTTSWGDPKPPAVWTTVDLSWPGADHSLWWYAIPAFFQQVGGSAPAQWVSTYGGSAVQVAFGSWTW